MKVLSKILVMIALIGSVNTFAAGSRGNAGCGLGNVLLEDKNGFWWEILATTLNGTSGNNTFGMTSGTSNCEISSSSTASLFIQANKVALANDIARGNGEALSSLGHLYGCQEGHNLGKALQKHYRGIFVNSENSAEAINNKIKNILKSSNASCKYII